MLWSAGQYGVGMLYSEVLPSFAVPFVELPLLATASYLLLIQLHVQHVWQLMPGTEKNSD